MSYTFLGDYLVQTIFSATYIKLLMHSFKVHLQFISTLLAENSALLYFFSTIFKLNIRIYFSPFLLYHNNPFTFHCNVMITYTFPQQTAQETCSKISIFLISSQHSAANFTCMLLSIASYEKF